MPSSIILACQVAATAQRPSCSLAGWHGGVTVPVCCLQYDVMVTAGANQAFTNVVLALLDASDRVALFK